MKEGRGRRQETRKRVEEKAWKRKENEKWVMGERQVQRKGEGND